LFGRFVNTCRLPSPASANPLMTLQPYSATTTSRHANIEWWRKALEMMVSSGLQHQKDATGSSRLVLYAGHDLVGRSKVDRVGKPLALGSVVSELRSLKGLLPLTDFLNEEASIYDPGWLPARIAAFVVGKPLWWALEQIGVVGEEGLLSSTSRNSHKDTGWWGNYVFVSLVERAGQQLLDQQRATTQGPGDVLYTWDSFRETFSTVVDGKESSLPEIDARILVKYLERDEGVLVVDQDIIKFVARNAPSGERSITAVDRGLLELKSAVKHLQAQVDGLQLKINECTRKASVALQQKYKPVALNQIRSRKLYQDLLEKRLNSLNTLEATLISVETAAGDLEIIKSYESSTATLRTILAHPSLQRASVDATMEALAEANADARDLDDAIRLGGNVAIGVGDNLDEDELEAELRALVSEAEVATKQAAESQDMGKLKGHRMQVPAANPVTAIEGIREAALAT